MNIKDIKVVSERDSYILECVKSGNCEYNYSEINSCTSSHRAEFRVFSDALKIDGVRINCSASLQMKIAKLLDCSLLTAKIADMIYEQRDITVTPFPQSITSSTEAMINHSKKIDNHLPNDYKGKIISTVGKHWIIDNKNSSAAINYGWHFEGKSFEGIIGSKSVSSKYKVIQNIGFAHNENHCDYSQTCVLINNSCDVDGNEIKFTDILKDPELLYLASHH